MIVPFLACLNLEIFFLHCSDSYLKTVFMKYLTSPKLTAISSAGVFHGAFLIYISLFHRCIPIYSRDFRAGTKRLTCLGLFTLSSAVSRHLYTVLCVKCLRVSWVTCCIFQFVSKMVFVAFLVIVLFSGILHVHIVLRVLLSSPFVHLKFLSSLIFCTVSLLFEGKGLFSFPLSVLGMVFCGVLKQVLGVTTLDVCDVKECVNKLSSVCFEVLEMNMQIFFSMVSYWDLLLSSL
jgi:hypothetical protein